MRKAKSLLNRIVRKYRIDVYNLSYRLIGSLDGYPFPPAKLINLVIGTREIAWYQLGGLFMHQAITTFLRRNGVEVNELKSVFDFGCGCGRITRWWSDLRHQCEIWGTDYNPDLIEWCQKKLSKMGKFKVNQANPPLDFADESFEFVYAYSVFTHFDINQQEAWFKELRRVVKTGGHLLITVHGKRSAWKSGFSSDWLEKLETDGVVVFGAELRGTNDCATYHSEKYMRDLQSSLNMVLVDHLPGGVRDSSEQDMYLFRMV